MTKTLTSHLLTKSANNRHGLTFAPQIANISKSDVQNIYYVGVPANVESPWRSAAGGVGRDEESAKLAAIAEGIERLSAGQKLLPLKTRKLIDAEDRIDPEHFALFSEEQINSDNFPFSNLYNDNCPYGQVENMETLEKKWVPQPMITLRDDYQTGIPTSSGLAAAETKTKAQLRAIQELIERDALMITWLHSIGGRELALPNKYKKDLEGLDYEVFVFDATPKYSPFAVTLVCGSVYKRGKRRFSLGSACRETWGDALEKAFLEWAQGIFFCGIYPKYVDSDELKTPNDVKSFDDHAIYFTKNPKQLKDVNLINKRKKISKSFMGKKMDDEQALKIAINKLAKNNIDLYWMDLTTKDSISAGLHVVRVLSPQMAPIFAHQQWPFIGGNVKNINQRYDQKSNNFPNPLPHPLG